MYIRDVEKDKILLELILNSTLVLTEIMKKKKRTKRKAIWVKEWLKRREQNDACNNTTSELPLVDSAHYRRYIRID